MGGFTLKQFADRHKIGKVQARGQLRRLVRDGLIEIVERPRLVVGGRSAIYRVKG